MLIEEYKKLDAALKQLDSGLEGVYSVLYGILSEPAKNYDLTFKNEKFHLTPPFYRRDEKSLKKLKRRYLQLILSYALKNRIKLLVNDKECILEKVYEILYALPFGEDPNHHQMEKISLADVYEAGDKEYGSSRPLDEEAYQVNLQNVKKFKEEDFVK